MRRSWVRLPFPAYKYMKIKTIKVGSLQTNCYIIIDEPSNEAIVVDPGDEADQIISHLKDLKIKYIVITHGHPDHFGALDEIKQYTKAPLAMSPEDSWFIKPDRGLKDGDQIAIGKLSFNVIHTPGHSKGCICLYTAGHLFSGDTLFAGTCGRMDLPGGSQAEMVNSLKRLASLPDNTIVYPGHGETTTIAKEKERGTLA